MIRHAPKQFVVHRSIQGRPFFFRRVPKLFGQLLLDGVVIPQAIKAPIVGLWGDWRHEASWPAIPHHQGA
jgi:hypothetical protein